MGMACYPLAAPTPESRLIPNSILATLLGACPRYPAACPAEFRLPASPPLDAAF